MDSYCTSGRFFVNTILPSLLIVRSARIPQIIKNFRKNSCEGGHSIRTFSRVLSSLIPLAGLSILFFVLSLMGNLS